jgi:hypothetical protein
MSARVNHKATTLFVITAIAATTTLNVHAQRRSGPAGGPHADAAPVWKTVVGSGGSFGVLFDTLPKPIGTIRPRGLYVVSFKPSDRSWKASGPINPDGYQIDVLYPGSAICDPAESVLCIWGAAFEFNDAGEVRQSSTGPRIGRLQTLTLRDRIMAGEAVGVLLDGLTSNIGTISGGGQYSVTFKPAERAWQASGPVFPTGFQTHLGPVTTALCDPGEYALCIWGAAFRFDEEGQVTDQRGRVGRILR